MKMGKNFPPCEEGYVALKVKPERPPGLMLEYWKNPQAMAKAFRGNWYFTGDKAYRDEEGYFWFIGRDKEIIKTAGQSVAPLEVERVLLEHPAVVDAAVIGIPVEKQTEIIKAFVQLKSTYAPSEKLSTGNSRLFEQAFGIPKVSSGVGVHRRITQDHYRKDQKVGVKESGDRKEKREMTRRRFIYGRCDFRTAS